MPYLLYYYLYNPRINFPFILGAPILGPFLTLISLVFISRSLTWFRCLLPAYFNLPKVEHAALVPSQTHMHFVLDANDKPKLVPDYEEVKQEEVKSEEEEIVENQEANQEENQEDDMVESGQGQK